MRRNYCLSQILLEHSSEYTAVWSVLLLLLEHLFCVERRAYVTNIPHDVAWNSMLAEETATLF